MRVWGSGSDVLDLGTLETKQCEICEAERPFRIVLRYRFWGIYRVFNVVTGKKYMLLCDVCQRGWTLDVKEVENALESVPIPFMHRFGILMGFGVLMAIFLLIALMVP